MGRAPAVLGVRAAAFGALAALLGLYYAFSESLWNASDWWDVTWLAFVLMPAVFALVGLVLPLQRARGLLFVSAAFGALAALATEAEIGAGGVRVAKEKSGDGTDVARQEFAVGPAVQAMVSLVDGGFGRQALMLGGGGASDAEQTSDPAR